MLCAPRTIARRCWAILAGLLLLIGSASADAASVIVVCPEPFREAFTPWVKFRLAQRHSLRFISSRGSPDDIRRGVREENRRQKIDALVLVGDVAAWREWSDNAIDKSVPAVTVPAKVNIHWGSEPEIGTDNWYADLDDDHVPDLAVGRLSADTIDELEIIVDKIIAYEQSVDFGAWRRRVHLVAGVGGFGPVSDAAIETAARQLITQGIPPEYNVSMTYGSWRSPFCPDPRQFHQTALYRLNEGSLFWVYLGHGHRRVLDRIQTPGGAYHILGARDVDQLKCTHGSPIAVMLACYTGAFDEEQDCLAEEMLRSAGGPVAVLAGSRMTMPYGMGVLATELLDETFRRRRATLGEVVLNAKRNSVLAARSDMRSRVLDTIGSLLSPAGAKLEEERYEHLHLMNLLGDPLLRLPQPEVVPIEAPATAETGSNIEVQFATPIAGRAIVELVMKRDRLPMAEPKRNAFPIADVDLAAYQHVYLRANDTRLSLAEFDVDRGRFAARLPVPPEAIGACHIRVMVEGESAQALGSCDVRIVKHAANLAAEAQRRNR